MKKLFFTLAICCLASAKIAAQVKISFTSPFKGAFSLEQMYKYEVLNINIAGVTIYNVHRFSIFDQKGTELFKAQTEMMASERGMQKWDQSKLQGLVIQRAAPDFST